MASEGEESAVDGYREATIKNVGKWRVDFEGLYKDGDILRAKSFDIEGMWTRYEGDSPARHRPSAESRPRASRPVARNSMPSAVRDSC